MTSSAKRPAATTRTLVLNPVNHTEVSPINVREIVSKGPHDSRCTVRGHTMSRVINWAYLRAIRTVLSVNGLRVHPTCTLSAFAGHICALVTVGTARLTVLKAIVVLTGRANSLQLNTLDAIVDLRILASTNAIRIKRVSIFASVALTAWTCARGALEAAILALIAVIVLLC